MLQPSSSSTADVTEVELGSLAQFIVFVTIRDRIAAAIECRYFLKYVWKCNVVCHYVWKCNVVCHYLVSSVSYTDCQMFSYNKKLQKAFCSSRISEGIRRQNKKIYLHRIEK